MKLDKNSKFSVKPLDVLRLDNEDWKVISVIPSNYGRGLSFTIRSLKTWQTIYCYPSSALYGAEIIKFEEVEK